MNKFHWLQNNDTLTFFLVPWMILPFYFFIGNLCEIYKQIMYFDLVYLVF